MASGLKRHRRGLVGVPAEQEDESLHGIFDSDAVPGREQIEQEAGDGGDRERGRDVVDGGQRLVEPVMNRMVEEVRVTVGVTKREPVRFEKEPHERTLVGIGHPRPHNSQARAMSLRLGAAAERSQSISYSAQELFDKVLFRAEVMEKDRSLRSERDTQRSQRQVGDAVGDDVVDSAVEKLLAALRIRRSGHHPARTRQGAGEVSD
jgi:hypothetical protein